MKSVIIIAIAVVVGIFLLLVTETIDLRPDESTEVRKYEDLKQRQNEWIAENCVNEKCNDGKIIEEKIREFIEINKITYDKNGINMYGLNQQGLDKYGRTEIQAKSVGDAYKQCISGANKAQGCAVYSGELCMASQKSSAYERCNQQSRLMNESFQKNNSP